MEESECAEGMGIQFTRGEGQEDRAKGSWSIGGHVLGDQVVGGIWG